MRFLRNKKIKHLENQCLEILYDKEHYYDSEYHDITVLNSEKELSIFGECNFKGTHSIKKIGHSYTGMVTALEFDMHLENFTKSYNVYLEEHLLFTAIRCGSNSGRPPYHDMLILDIDRTQRFFNYLRPKLKSYHEAHDMISEYGSR